MPKFSMLKEAVEESDYRPSDADPSLRELIGAPSDSRSTDSSNISSELPIALAIRPRASNHMLQTAQNSA